VHDGSPITQPFWMTNLQINPSRCPLHVSQFLQHLSTTSTCACNIRLQPTLSALEKTQAPSSYSSDPSLNVFHQELSKYKAARPATNKRPHHDESPSFEGPPGETPRMSRRQQQDDHGPRRCRKNALHGPQTQHLRQVEGLQSGLSLGYFGGGHMPARGITRVL
jgi:hypothetical protein